ncbi:PQ-loop-domain-containing protein [Rhizodiscina lignyota]|uniref:PQ-loop-domain-containing protein n=1 Tax=Rhizodiscina lignyota TaxID=1504668 RepID=A0A9P4I910_9PEZI|nr:PQ-loop-domain-containing protein [Rhizodiscina lignyota]
MYPPSQGLNLDIEALSGICGSISIACWVVVFSPQIIKNFQRGSAEGLSIVFIVVWLAGDVFNILGAVLQGVLPTMIILAVYYTIADIVLLAQCFYYEGFTLKDKVNEPNGDAERTPLLRSERAAERPARISDADRRGSSSSIRDRFLSIDGTHLSPATPLVPDSDPTNPPDSTSSSPQSTLQVVIFNVFAIVLVCFAGVFGWWLSNRNRDDGSPKKHEVLGFNILGQVFGYICAVLYLGSRVPQLLLNYRRKSTEGISMLFFLFACIGNLTYVMSILAYSPVCEHPKHCKPSEAGAIYARYFAVNFSWLLGSFGTLLLDAGVFVQYFMYRKDDDSSDSGESTVYESFRA